MTSNLPRTPETPSHTSPSAADLPSKPVMSPTDTHSMPTPARSVNGSMSSINTEVPSEGVSQDDSSLKRKRDPEDQGDQEQKKVHVEKSENHKVTIADLSENVGELYLFCKTRKASFFLRSIFPPGLVFQTPIQPCTSFIEVLG